MNWAQKVKTGIDCYDESALPLVDEGFYEVASIEIGNSISLLRDGFYNSPLEIV